MAIVLPPWTGEWKEDPGQLSRGETGPLELFTCIRTLLFDKPTALFTPKTIASCRGPKFSPESKLHPLCDFDCQASRGTLWRLSDQWKTEGVKNHNSIFKSGSGRFD